jgi:glutathione S-transferase
VARSRRSRSARDRHIRARHRRDPSELSETCRKGIRRIDEIWSDCRTRYGGAGPWLFGELSVADIMFAPVALRFVTYDIAISDAARQFQRAVVELEPVREWIAAATQERESVAFIDDLVPAAKSPLTLG